MSDNKTPVNRSAASSRSGAPAAKAAPKPAAAPASAAAQRTSSKPKTDRTPQSLTSPKDTVSQDLLEASEPVSKSTAGLLGALEAHHTVPKQMTAAERAKKSLDTANQIDGQNHHWFWGTDMKGMRADLKANWQDPRAVLTSLRREDFRDEHGITGTILKQQLGQDLTDAQLKQLGTTPDGRALINELIKPYQGYGTTNTDLAQIKRLTQGMPKHAGLLDDKLTPEIKAKLKANGLTHQPLTNGYGQVNFDELSFTVNKMPPGMTPEKLLQMMADDPNKTLGGARSEMGDWCLFQRREHGPAKAGDIYDIDIFGPENGSVVMKDKTPNQFTLSTVDGPPYGEHPIYGNRQFGFDKNEDGSVTFYTRAADRRQWQGGIMPVGAETAGKCQADTWRCWQLDMAREIEGLGGTLRPNSFRESFEMQ